ncbi:hypothetical protein [uncultured Sphingomonas sp.]|uniref:hypothetical protein n=1 Tax=uncultured Sphingomonas sp. TaxID=158754 RepID=UPI0035CB47A6
MGLTAVPASRVYEGTAARYGGQAMTSAYETSIDRAGLAIGAGGLICGAIATILAVAAGQADGAVLATTFLGGGMIAAAGITALAALPWALLHGAGRRGPGHAAALGGAIGFVLFLAGQTHGFGLLAPPGIDARAALFRWASAIATSVALAAMAAGIGVAMWRVAYRRLR